MSDETAATNGGSDVIRVMIADDHALFRQGLKIVLDNESDLAVVAEASDGEEAVERAVSETPDIILMDVRMPKLSGIDAAARLKQELPTSKIVMLTVSDDEQDLFEAIKAGASGYLLKEIDPSEIAGAIRQIQGGQSLLSPS